MNRPIRIGMHLYPEHTDYAGIRDAVLRAEDAGVDLIFNWDHFFPLHGDSGGRHFEALSMLGAWAESTSRIEIGTLVTCNSFRNPDLLADMARTLDHISGGRYVLGIGAGWFPPDYLAYGYEFGTAGSRLSDLEQALPRIRRRWAALNPPPLRDIPILIGGAGERRTLRYAAEHADVWHWHHLDDISVLEHKNAVLDRHCADIGRDPAEIERSVGVLTSGPSGLADELAAFGTTLFTVGVPSPDYDLSVIKEWLDWRDAVSGGS
jgi:probable F420-dependent oxidoreductase